MSDEIISRESVQRLRLTFSKGGPARFISHLDLARALERALNRAKLPVAYSRGFKQRPRMSLAAALPLGYTGEAELADVWVVESIDAESFLIRLMQTMAPGIVIHMVEEVPLRSPALQQLVIASFYEVAFLDAISREDLESRVLTFLGTESFPWERRHRKHVKPRRYDLRPMVLSLEVNDGPTAASELFMHLRQTQEQTGRPDDVLAALGFDPLDAHVHRRAIQLKDG